MTEQLCIYATLRDDVLIAYLYDEMPPEDKPGFERHLSICAICRSELDVLGGVRTELQQWTVPGSPNVAVVAPPRVSRPRSLWMGAQDMPPWARVAAAVLLFGAGLGLANLEVSYTPAGLSVQTGWRHVDQTAAAARSVPVEPALTATSVASAALQSDLARLADEVHTVRDRQAALAAAASTPADDDMIRRVRALIQESEQRQQRELALRVAEMSRDVQTQRQADLVRIDRSLGIIQNRTGMEVMRTQQQVNSLAQRVSQRQ